MKNGPEHKRDKQLHKIRTRKDTEGNRESTWARKGLQNGDFVNTLPLNKTNQNKVPCSNYIKQKQIGKEIRIGT